MNNENKTTYFIKDGMQVETCSECGGCGNMMYIYMINGHTLRRIHHCFDCDGNGYVDWIKKTLSVESTGKRIALSQKREIWKLKRSGDLSFLEIYPISEWDETNNFLDVVNHTKFYQKEGYYDIYEEFV